MGPRQKRRNGRVLKVANQDGYSEETLTAYRDFPAIDESGFVWTFQCSTRKIFGFVWTFPAIDVVRQHLSTGLKLKRKSRYLGLSLGIHPS
ncbi:hypothetical protein NC651_028154 [Populus alba x Populus x berolinensis]|nr:hypothetical protein NC651_028154 [Populus alba x Populus x berolinensis]